MLAGAEVALGVGVTAPTVTNSLSERGFPVALSKQIKVNSVSGGEVSVKLPEFCGVLLLTWPPVKNGWPVALGQQEVVLNESHVMSTLPPLGTLLLLTFKSTWLEKDRVGVGEGVGLGEPPKLGVAIGEGVTVILGVELGVGEGVGPVKVLTTTESEVGVLPSLQVMVNVMLGLERLLRV